jgi:hypothetical protein
VFLAGMASYPGNGAINSVRNYPTVAVAVAGGQPNGVGYLLDGAIYQDPYNNMSLPLPFPDAFQEFNVETSAVPAQYGYHASAVVTAVTKCGTNQFHGDFFDFLRNGALDSRDFFASARDTLRRNQFGGTLGGPIKKDKLFFFVGNQETLQRSAPTQNTAFIPTPAAAAGNFAALMSPACNNGQQITLPSSYGFVNNQISPTLLNPVALKILSTMPIPSNNCGSFCCFNGNIHHSLEFPESEPRREDLELLVDGGVNVDIFPIDLLAAFNRRPPFDGSQRRNGAGIDFVVLNNPRIFAAADHSLLPAHNSRGHHAVVVAHGPGRHGFEDSIPPGLQGMCCKPVPGGLVG